MSLVSTAGIKDTPTRLAIQKLADKLDEDKAPTFAGMTFAGKVTVGSFGSPLDVTATRKYGFEIHWSGNDYDVTGLRSRASLITTADSSTRTACGALLQAANSDGISVSVLNGALIEAMGKSTATAATISTMRGLLINTEWSAKDTVTDLRVLHVRTHTRDNATEGYFSNSGYGIYLENEAVGGNGQALTSGIYFKGTNLSAGNKAFTYGIDFSGGTFGTAEIRFSNGETIDNLTDGRLSITGDLAISGTLIGYLKYDTFAGDTYTLDTAGITLTAGTLTAAHLYANSVLHIKDVLGGHYLEIVAEDEAYSANCRLSISLNDISNIYLTFTGSPTLGDWFNQSVKTGVDVVHNDLTLSTPSNIYALSHDSFADVAGAKHYDWTNETHNFLTTGTGQFANLGVGTLPSVNQIITATKNLSCLSATGVYGGPTNLSAVAGSDVIGLVFTSKAAPSIAVPDYGNPLTLGEIGGCEINAILQGASTHYATLTAEGIFGYKSKINLTKTSVGAVVGTFGRHFWATNASLSGATLTTQYAFYDEGMTTGGSNWGFYGLSAQNYLAGDLEVGGDTFWTGSGSGLAFGCIEGTDETITCTDQSTWYQVTFDTAGQSNLTTVSIANEEITVSKAGVYLVSVIALFDFGMGTENFEMMVKKNDGATDLSHTYLFPPIFYSGKVENAAGTCLIALSANDRIELWIQCTTTAGEDAVFKYVSLTCVQVGG